MVGGGAAIGPYSCGKIIRTDQGAWGYSSGQIGKSAKTGQLVGKTPTQQTKQAMINLKALAKANGFKLDTHTVKTTVFITSMADFAECNAVYAKYFKEDCLPARSCVAVKELPMGALFEVEAVFFKA